MAMKNADTGRVSIGLVMAMALATAACSEPAPQPAAESIAPTHASAAPVAPDIPAGDYTLDKAHATLIFSVNHLGFSNYTAQFKTFDAALTLDPKNPAAAALTASVDMNSLDLTNGPKGFVESLRGPEWIDAKQFPKAQFVSTSIAMTAPDSATVTGDLTLHGVTRPITLDARFNGGYAGHPYDPNARIGFSARGVFKRSDFGIDIGIPAPGTTMGVFDDVTVVIETEFTGPPLETAPSATPPG